MEIGAIIGLATTLLGAIVMFYREVRKRADLEKELHGYAELKDFYQQLVKEYDELHADYETLEEYAQEVEGVLVDNLDTDDLTAAINSVFGASGNGSVAGNN